MEPSFLVVVLSISCDTEDSIVRKMAHSWHMSIWCWVSPRLRSVKMYLAHANNYLTRIGLFHLQAEMENTYADPVRVSIGTLWLVLTIVERMWFTEGSLLIRIGWTAKYVITRHRSICFDTLRRMWLGLGVRVGVVYPRGHHWWPKAKPQFAAVKRWMKEENGRGGPD